MCQVSFASEARIRRKLVHVQFGHDMGFKVGRLESLALPHHALCCSASAPLAAVSACLLTEQTGTYLVFAKSLQCAVSPLLRSIQEVPNNI